MKDLKNVFVARPTLKIGILMIAFATLLTTTKTWANDLDEELILESWMATPFESEIQEPELILESWMATPFESEIQESELILESWMNDAWI